MCWKELVFNQITGWHGNVIDTSNCCLSGNQTCIIGRVLIHTGATELINEKLQVKLKGKMFKLSVIEEIENVVEADIDRKMDGDNGDENDTGENFFKSGMFNDSESNKNAGIKSSKQEKMMAIQRRPTCSISDERLKKVGEQIGVVWNASVEGRLPNVLGNHDKDVGVDGKKGWVKSIIQRESPDVIAMQETKYGVVDDSWVEE
ncbi:transposon TX1, partial [Tanacetum coccineum]